MGLGKIRDGLSKAARAIAVGSLAAGAPSQAQSVDEPRPQEQGVQKGSGLFELKDIAAPTEGSPFDRKEFAEELFAFVLRKGQFVEKDGSSEMLFPLATTSERLTIRVIVFPSARPDAREMRVLIFRMDDSTPIALVDSGITGTPAEHQMPVIENRIPRPQGFIMSGEHPLANRIYLGILNQLLRKF